MTSHPSFLELDAHAISPRDDETSKHVRECQQCSAHVAAVRIPSPFPSALEQSAEKPPRSFTWWPFALATVAVCAVLIIVTRPPPPPHEEIITPKGGTPAVALWLKRGDIVTPWKPGERVTRDAAVRWEIAPAGFTHVRVLDRETMTVLFESRVPGDAPVLTPAWTFDGTRPSEKVRVVLTRDDRPLPPELRCDASPGDVWCSEYLLELEPR